MTLEPSSLCLWLGSWLKCENAYTTRIYLACADSIGWRDRGKSTEDKAQDGKRVEGGMERKPGESLWVTGQDDGPCRPE